MEDMNPEELKKQKQAAADAARVKADALHDQVAGDPGNEDLRKQADEAEDLASDLQAETDAIVVPAAPEEVIDETGADDKKDIDFEEELRELEDGGQKPPASPPPKKTELEKARRALFFNKQRVLELGGDPDEIEQAPKPKDPPPPPAKQPEDQDMSNYVTKDDVAEQIASSVSRSEAETKVIIWHYKHSIQKTGNVNKDIENAYLLANKGRINRSFAEIRRAVESRKAPPITPSRGPKTPQQQTPTLSAGDQATLRRRGYTPRPDGTWESKRYIMRYDPTKKAMVEEKKK
jgi:hypothetical protein